MTIKQYGAQLSPKKHKECLFPTIVQIIGVNVPLAVTAIKTRGVQTPLKIIQNRELLKKCIASSEFFLFHHIRLMKTQPHKKRHENNIIEES